MQMCHFGNWTIAPSNACNLSFRYRMIFYEVSNSAELPDASMDIKHLPLECHILKLSPLSSVMILFLHTAND